MALIFSLSGYVNFTAVGLYNITSAINAAVKPPEDRIATWRSIPDTCGSASALSTGLVLDLSVAR